MGIPCNVYTEVVFNKVLDVDLTHGTMSILIWLRLRWRDPRLTWDPIDWNNITILFLDQHEIWNPEIEIWNSQDGIAASFQEQKAYVNYTGHVFLSRRGEVNILCNLEDLENFPYDQSRCKFELGSWVYDNSTVKLSYHNKGFILYESQTGGNYSKYAEYNVKDVKVQEHMYDPFNNFPQNNGSWYTVVYTVILERHHMQYTFGIILPQILLTFVSFGAFWLPPSTDERIGFTVTIALAIIVYKLLMHEQLPASQALVFIQKVSFGCFSFSMFVVMQSIFVMLWQRTDPYFMSVWRSFKKFRLDFKELSDWVNVVRAIDVEISKRKRRTDLNLSSSRRNTFLQKVFASTVGRRASTSEQLPAIPSGEVTQPNPFPNVHYQENRGQKAQASQDTASQDSQSIQDLEIQGDLHITSPLDAIIFIYKVLKMRKHLLAQESFERLKKRYSEDRVMEDLLSMMGIYEGSVSHFTEEATLKYNRKWRKLSNYVDRVCQMIVPPVFTVLLIGIILSVIVR
eukprot:TRINITY_DN5126_c0_g2_i1.p1 TRINITY_DN5126_c0_g2~~TRINITY_DN5126_c0_g2_i1.p1  ORF type:complete len:513 (+),score=16.87 TRINITY_DN5126_c0_g2_i1:832-2370(+)